MPELTAAQKATEAGSSLGGRKSSSFSLEVPTEEHVVVEENALTSHISHEPKVDQGAHLDTPHYADNLIVDTDDSASEHTGGFPPVGAGSGADPNWFRGAGIDMQLAEPDWFRGSPAPIEPRYLVDPNHDVSKKTPGVRFIREEDASEKDTTYDRLCRQSFIHDDEKFITPGEATPEQLLEKCRELLAPMVQVWEDEPESICSFKRGKKAIEYMVCALCRPQL